MSHISPLNEMHIFFHLYFYTLLFFSSWISCRFAAISSSLLRAILHQFYGCTNRKQTIETAKRKRMNGQSSVFSLHCCIWMLNNWRPFDNLVCCLSRWLISLLWFFSTFYSLPLNSVGNSYDCHLDLFFIFYGLFCVLHWWRQQNTTIKCNIRT